MVDEHDTDECTTLSTLKERVVAFAHERAWESFHSPKNLSMSIAIEAAELMEEFQWAGADGGARVLEERRAHVEDELADVFLYVLGFAARFRVDLSEASARKLEKNARKYPV